MSMAEKQEKTGAGAVSPVSSLSPVRMWVSSVSQVTRFSVLRTVSSLYSLLLLSIYIVCVTIKFVGVGSPTGLHYTQIEVDGLFLYLLLVSCLSFLYILVYLAPSPSRAQHSHHSHGSAFLRQGAVLFGSGMLLHTILNFMELVSFPSCLSWVQLASRLLSIVFVVLQTLTILVCPRLNLWVGWGGPHLSLMHIVTTNLVLWMGHVLKESLHEFHEAHERDSSNSESVEEGEGLDRERRQASHPLPRPTHPMGEECDQGGDIYTIIRALDPVLFAFTIEFTLIGAAVFYNTWRAVTTKLSGEGQGLIRPQVRATIRKTDWSNSLLGLLTGLLIFVLNLASLGIFFSIASLEHHTDEYVAKVISSLVYAVGLATAAVATAQVQGLQDKAEGPTFHLDSILLKFGLCFLFVFTLFTVTVGLFPTGRDDIPGELHVITGVLNILQAAAQVILIEILLTKCLPAGEVNHPGRQPVTALILLNLGLWLVDTFEMQKFRASGAEAAFYGPLVWIPIQRITLPVCIFFRFHSCVMLVECWKSSYKVEEEEKGVEQLEMQPKS